MKKTLFLSSAILLAMAVLPATVKAQEIEAYPSYVDASGYAEREVAPDVFYMQVVLNETDSKGRISVESQQRQMLAALRSIGIDTEKQVTRLSLASEYHNRRSNYSAASYQIKLKKAEDVSNVWQKLDEIGVSDVSFTKAEYSGIEALKKEVRQEAVRNAQEIASSMAEAIGQSIGKCFYISSGYSGNTVLYAQPRKSMAMMTMDAMAVEEESIEFDNIKVTVNVSTKFVLE